MRPRVVVIGGGLTGLATGWRLRDIAEVVVLDAHDRVGGQVATVDLAGAALDVGADAVLARQPEGEALVRDAGLGDDLVAPLARTVLLLVRGALRPLPAGTVFGAPTDLNALARSGVLTPHGLARAAVEPVLPRRFVAGDRSVADLVGERFGREVVDVLVEPLLGGVYAGRAQDLSAEATVPPVWAAARDHRSLAAGLGAHRRRVAADDRPVFLTLRGGLGRLVDRLASDLGDRMRRGTSATSLGHDGAAWQVTTATGSLTADHVVVAVPASAAADLVRDLAPGVSRELAGIRTASVGVVALAYDRSHTAAVPDASGVLVPRRAGRSVKALTLSSRKWPHQAEAGRFLVRASVGRVDDTAALDLDDDVLAERVDGEVRSMLGITAAAAERVVVRWPDALPQYEVGHLQRVERIRHGIQAGLPPGLHVGGAALDGVGLAARAREAARISDEIRDEVVRPVEATRGAPEPQAPGQGPGAGPG